MHCRCIAMSLVRMDAFPLAPVPVQVFHQFCLLWPKGARETKYQGQPQCNSDCYKYRCLQWR